MKRWALLTISIALLLTSLGHSAAAASSDAVAFQDIDGHWARDTIQEMVGKGILNGYPDGTFRPNDPVKVDQFVKMLILSYSELHENGSRSWNKDFLDALSPENQAIIKQDYRYFSFKPNTVGYWAKDFIDIASDLHFMNKDRYADFQADMKRENVAEIIYYTLQETEFLEDNRFGQRMAEAYGDIVSASDREQRFIAETLVKGIMEGYPSGFFGVGEEVTRAEALVILQRLRDKTKRIAIEVSPDNLERIVPTAEGGNKIIVFPDQRMWDAYETLTVISELRGSNHDLYGTTLRLYRDQTEKDNVQNRPSGSASPREEAAIWLDPQYNTYGVTISLREGALARNQEVVDGFANGLFGYNASAFRELFANVCNRVENGEMPESEQAIIGTDTVQIMIDGDTIVFSIAKKA
ncbi:S-layer homology domain-containing protein [Paenibacillus sp. J5C_2022]|uniref:S-layer homology domain-containing protein n=1 Tax=Paenibacillus sp. J5C2022 TaxID=2977129 RepID=UPI0021D0E9DB|nr:S-layer homology domain-containing protein [Paenibacillus sp. J5C2022]MCU6712238.1 S-layer homology domain-containing protein [Paenibacillus sp. J5C2022]